MNDKQSAHKTSYESILSRGYLYTGIFLIAGFILFSTIVSLSNHNVLHEMQFLKDFDQHTVLYVSSIHHSTLDYLMKIVSEYGREVFWVFVILVCFVFGGYQGKVIFIIVLFSLLIVIPINILTKEVSNRDRPNIQVVSALLEQQEDKSYPSGHASVVAVGITAFGLFLKKTRRNLLIFSGLLCEGLLVFASRLYFGVHYPTDIIGGIILGSGITFFVSTFYAVFFRIVYTITNKISKGKRL